MKSERRLTIEFGNGSNVDEYRIRNRSVEFRPCRRNYAPSGRNEWRRLAPGDIAQHLILRTAVGEWLTFLPECDITLS